MTIDKLSDPESLVRYLKKESFFSSPECRWIYRKMRLIPLIARICRIDRPILSVIVAEPMKSGGITGG